MPQSQTILITGGAGYIGSHTAKCVAQAGHTPIIFDDLSEGNAWAIKYGTHIHASLADPTAIQKAFNDHNIDAVIHFAASVHVGDSVTNPIHYYENNVIASLNLLNAMIQANVKHIIFSSTCATYGEPAKVPIDENNPQLPVNPYGETKLVVERALQSYAHAYGLRYAALRYFNAAGADPDGELGEIRKVETHLIPIALFAAMGRRAPLKVFGTDYPTPDGTCVRDYIHINDLADAHLRALDYLHTHDDNIAVNLGTGTGYSIRQVLDTIEKITGLVVPAEDAPRRKGDPPELIADPGKAKALLNWVPRHSDLETIIQNAYNFYDKNPDRLT